MIEDLGKSSHWYREDIEAIKSMLFPVLRECMQEHGNEWEIKITRSKGLFQFHFGPGPQGDAS